MYDRARCGQLRDTIQFLVPINGGRAQQRGAPLLQDPEATRRPPSTLRPSLTEGLRLLREQHRVATVFDRHAMGAELRVQLPVLRQRCGFPRMALQDGPADAQAISRQRTVQTCAPLE